MNLYKKAVDNVRKYHKDYYERMEEEYYNRVEKTNVKILEESEQGVNSIYIYPIDYEGEFDDRLIKYYEDMGFKCKYIESNLGTVICIKW